MPTIQSHMLTPKSLDKIKTDMRSSLTKGRLHFAAHSHHPWPEATQAAQNQYWLDSTKHLDSKWGNIFSEVMPQARKHIAQLTGIKDSTQIIEGTNTFEFVGRIFSCLDFSKPIRILTTDSEFYSFARVASRLTENANVKIDFVPTQPFATFEERFAEKAKSQNYELIFSSLVFFNSGFYATGLLEKLDQLNLATDRSKTQPTIIAVDLYHAYGAVPLELEKYAQKMFFMGGSYKYLSSGEGACFLTVPKDCQLRPWQTGWFADYKSLENGVKDKISYSNDGHRFAGATYDPTPWYRFNAVVKWWGENSLTPATIHAHVRGLQDYFVKQLATHKTLWTPSDVLGYQDHKDWANFLALKTENPQKVVQDLRAQDIFVDARNEFVRFGFGYYQSTDDIDQLFKALVAYKATTK
jgi:kynureninase